MFTSEIPHQFSNCVSFRLITGSKHFGVEQRTCIECVTQFPCYAAVLKVGNEADFGRPEPYPICNYIVRKCNYWWTFAVLVNFRYIEEANLKNAKIENGRIYMHTAG